MNKLTYWLLVVYFAISNIWIWNVYWRLDAIEHPKDIWMDRVEFVPDAVKIRPVQTNDLYYLFNGMTPSMFAYCGMNPGTNKTGNAQLDKLIEELSSRSHK